MSVPTTNKKQPKLRCAIYTRKSTSEGLEAEITSLDVQRQAGEAYIQSQAPEGWVCLPQRYDDGGYSGADLKRPAIERLLADIQAGRVDVVVVYKVDRLTRSLIDFARLVSVFDERDAAFVAVTQQFNKPAARSYSRSCRQHGAADSRRRTLVCAEYWIQGIRK